MKKSTLFSIAGLSILILLLASCTKYKPTVQFSLYGNEVLIQDSVETVYANIGMSGCVTTVRAASYPYAFRLSFNSNAPGNYPCNQSNYNNSIEIIDQNNNLLSTFQMAGSSGNIKVIQAGQNIVEGYFSAVFVLSNGDEVKINNGIFSGQAIGITSTCK